MMAVVCTGFVFSAHAQYKGPRNYFPKNNPAPPPAGAQPAAPAPAVPNAPKAPSNQPPAAAQLPKFKDLPVNSTFYFTSDTNRTYAWVKLTDSTAKNSKNGITQTINGETLIQR